jgi:Protein-tyrosine phosphatase
MGPAWHAGRHERPPHPRLPYDPAMGIWEDGSGVVALPDGRRVRARGLRRTIPPGPAPDFGVYLASRDPGPFAWEHRWVRWLDFRTPASTTDALAALREAHERAATERVEVACGGGVGRTGTALAAMAVLAGVDPAEAVAWVRARYDRRAVETPWQRRWVRRLDRVR